MEGWDLGDWFEIAGLVLVGLALWVAGAGTGGMLLGILGLAVFGAGVRR